MTFRLPTKHPQSSAPISSGAPEDRNPADELREAIAPVFEAATESASLVANEFPISLGGAIHRIPKFLLLGESGGGTPMNIGIFAGFEGGNLETTRALAEVVLQFRASPALTRDYALTAYPAVNLQGLLHSIALLDEFEKRYARNSPEEDVQFFQREFRLWSFEGFISIRRDERSNGFYANVRSGIIAREVVEEAMAAAASALTIAAQPVRIRQGVGHQAGARARFAPPENIRTQPFDIELCLPPNENPFDQADALYVTIAEILRQYRTFIVHAQEL